MLPKTYRIVPLGPSGSGKSQLCNFIYKDITNKKFEVSAGFDAQTKFPQSEIFTRKIDGEDIKLELIDTAGCSDSLGDDEVNFKKLVIKLKEKKTIDLFLLVFNFANNRIDKQTRDYIKLIANTFTPTEFYNHLAIVFTRYPENPTNEDKKLKELKTGKIIELIRNTIGIANGQAAIPPNIYELDTNPHNGNFIPKFQATIDVIIIKMQDIISLIGPVNTENIKYCGVKDRLKEEQRKLEQQKLEFQRIKKMEEEKKKIYEELMKKREEKIKAENEQNKKEKIILQQRWRHLENETRRRQEYFDRLESEHRSRMEKLDKLISDNKIKIDEVNGLIDEKKRLINKEEDKKWDGIKDKVFGGILLFTLIGIPWGVQKIEKGNETIINAENRIDQLNSEIKECEENKKKYEEEKKNAEDAKNELKKDEENDEQY